METYLNLFEEAIRKQVQLVGEEEAFSQAKKAGLGVSPEGHIVSCTGNPQVVLLRLIRFFTSGGNMEAMLQCTPLINEMLKETQQDSNTSEKPEAVQDTV